MPHHDRGEEEGGSVAAMQTGETVEHPLAVLVAELVARDQGHEEETHQQGHHEHPHEGIAVVAAGDPHVHDVPRPEPGQHDDDARPERARVLEE